MIRNTNSNPDLVQTNYAHLFLPQTGEGFSYDLDGNQTIDGRWMYGWDGENRLTRMWSRSSTPTNSWMALYFAYDHQGRRISKVVSNWNGSAWVKASEQRFVYDGWNLVAVLNSDLSPQLSFAWGLDLSGTVQGAGGAGGLLSMTVYSGNLAGTYFYAYDGNGNVMALVNAADGTVAAQYEYSPFGEVVRATGPMAKANPFRFSTKYQDDESDIIVYPYRPYSTTLGRFLTHDPLEEQGGLNVYGFTQNDAINSVDPLGFSTIKDFIRDGVTGSAAKMTQAFGWLASWTASHPGSINTANTIIDWLQPYLLNLVDQNPETMGWVDLTMAWFLEGGPSAWNFDATARTTGDLKNEDGVNQARAEAKAKLAKMTGPGPETVKKHWKYDQAAFYNGIRTLDLATSFTGSYDVTVTVKCQKNGPYDHRFTFDVYNVTSWESGTRLNEDHSGIISSRPRGGNGLHLGGNMTEDWIWGED